MSETGFKNWLGKKRQEEDNSAGMEAAAEYFGVKEEKKKSRFEEWKEQDEKTPTNEVKPEFSALEQIVPGRNPNEKQDKKEDRPAWDVDEPALSMAGIKERGLELIHPRRSGGKATALVDAPGRVISGFSEGFYEVSAGLGDLLGIDTKFSDEALERVRKNIEESGGRDIYSGIGKAGPDLLMMLHFENGLKAVLPWLRSKGTKEIAKMSGKKLAQELGKKAGKRSVTDAAVLGAIEGIKSGGDPEEILNGVVAGAVAGPVFTVAPVAVRKAGGKKFAEWLAGKGVSAKKAEGAAEKSPAADMGAGETPERARIVPGAEETKMSPLKEAWYSRGKDGVKDWLQQYFYSDIEKTKMLGDDIFRDYKNTQSSYIKVDSMFKNGRRIAGYADESGELKSVYDTRYSRNRVVAPIEGKTTAAPTFKKTADTSLADVTDRYLYAKHTQEMAEIQPDFNTGMAREEAENYIAQVENTLKKEDPEAYAAVMQTATRFREWTTALVEYLEEKKYISSDDAANILSTYKNYIPLRRVFDLVEQKRMGFTPGRGTILKRRSKTGSKRAIYSPIDTMTDNYFKAVSAADRNEVRLRALETAKNLSENPESGVGSVKVKTPFSPAKASVKQAGEKTKVEISTPKLSANEVPVRVVRDGKAGTEIWELENNYLASAVRHGESDVINQIMMSWPVRTLNATRRAFQSATTSVPEFMFWKNPWRDFRSRLQLDENISANPMKGIPQGIQEVIASIPGDFARIVGGDDFYNAIAQEGGFSGGYWADLSREMQKSLRGVKPKSRLVAVVKTAGDWASSPLYAAEKAGSIIEQLPRFNAAEMHFKKLVKEGMDVETALKEAAMKARDITADFAEGGSAIKLLNTIVPFSKSSVAGARQFFRAMKKDPTGFMIKGFTTTFAPAFALWMANKDKDWYRAMTQRDHAMWQPVTEHFWIPKSYDVDAVFNTLPIGMIDSWYNKDPKRALFALKNLKESFLPIEPGYIMEGGGHPLTTANKVRKPGARHPYFDFSIEPEATKGLDPSERAYTFNSETGKEITKQFKTITDAIDLSPAKFDAVLTALLSTTGRYGLEISDLLVIAGRAAAGEKTVRPARDLSELPFTRAIVHPNKMYRSNNAFTQDFYQLFKDASQRYNTWKQMEDGDRKDKYFNSHKDLIDETVYKELKSAYGTLRQNRKKMIEIADPRNTEFSAKQKYHEVRKLAFENSELARDTLRDFKKRENERR